jgi:hypothetical protein
MTIMTKEEAASYMTCLRSSFDESHSLPSSMPLIASVEGSVCFGLKDHIFKF